MTEQPKVSIWRYVPAIIVGCILIAFAVMLFKSEDERSALGPVLINKSIPKFSVPTITVASAELDNEIAFAMDDLQNGRVSVVNFWASWCVPCRIEHPELMKLKTNANIDVYGINYKDEAASAAKFLRKLGNPYLKTGFDEYGRVGIDWGVYRIPVTFVVNQTGQILYRHEGPIQNDDVQAKFLPVIQSALSDKLQQN